MSRSVVVSAILVVVVPQICRAADVVPVDRQAATVLNCTVGARKIIDNLGIRNDSGDIVMQIDCPALFEGS